MVYNCPTTPVSEKTFDCAASRKNCLNITGVVSCRRGLCHRVVPTWVEYPLNECDRVCDGLPLGGRLALGEGLPLTPGGRRAGNVVLLAGDRVVTAHCNRGVDTGLQQATNPLPVLARPRQISWDTEVTHGHILFTSCTG
jgi:hypothetical protein